MESCDQAFERSVVEAAITTSVISIKNPLEGRCISVPYAGDVIRDISDGSCEVNISHSRACHECAREGGISCYYIRELDNFLPKVSLKPDLVQNEIHPYYQDTAVIRHIQENGIAVQGWYPLGGRGYTSEMLSNPVLVKIAKQHDKSVAQIILRWNQQRGVIAIPVSSNEKHIKENISVFDFVLSDDEMKMISSLDRHEKHDWY